MSKTIISFGELLWDIFPTGEVLGGAPSNFAYRMNTFGHEAWLVTRVGKDDRGKRAIDQLRAKGMPADYIQRDDTHATGTVPVELDVAGSPTFNILRDVAYDYIEITPELLALAAMADCICFGTLIQRSETSRHTLYSMLDAAPQALRVLDLNLRKDCYTRETITASLERAEILKLNENEAQVIASIFNLPDTYANFAPAAVKQWNLQACVVTLGEKGLVAANSQGEFIQRPGHKVQVVDTVGSGDAVTSGFLHCYLEGRPFAECCGFGNAAGALVAATRGGMTFIDPAAILKIQGSERSQSRKSNTV
jgi:fructokinase